MLLLTAAMPTRGDFLEVHGWLFDRNGAAGGDKRGTVWYDASTSDPRSGRLVAMNCDEAAWLVESVAHHGE